MAFTISGVSTWKKKKNGVFTLVTSENRTRAPGPGIKCEHSLSGWYMIFLLEFYRKIRHLGFVTSCNCLVLSILFYLAEHDISQFKPAR